LFLIIYHYSFFFSIYSNKSSLEIIEYYEYYNKVINDEDCGFLKRIVV
jgi:hypothetical protein